MINAQAHPQKPAASAPEIKRIGRFTVIRELGRGAIGVVYLVHDPIIDRQIAIKTFNPKLTQLERKKHEEQLINEARAAGRLSHPHIVTIFDANTEGGMTFIAMEYLQGRELSRLLARQHPFELNDIAAIIWKVADALDYAHRNGVVHRDIKPANIFMVGENQPKVVDFGIARSPNRVADQFAQTNDAPYTLFHNNILGTPTYMSPEQACGEPADLRSDIYALGAVMYEMLAGRKPFQSQDTEKLLQMIALKTPPAPHELNPEVPEALSQIVMKAMQKRPEKRYQHAHEMANDIKRYLVKGKRPQPPKPEQKNKEKASGSGRRWLFLVAGLLAAAGTAAILLPRLLN
ncbi:serine/threonine-protein kinase [Paucimonas lemoignei]|uniref:non-specific serine/threonine protein kinase n=1 Tax=Paucimonas lemoignei TaxID=29443 RepID=A0A4R3HQ16_PAULE|nr:serine/threonine-protein kinase [Paucimonas lemoignei]TCS34035.1 serine/threonine-protein kinase [Paucimonas lemoignei]